MSEEGKRLFKKFEDNRRLYDDTASRYATIGDVVVAVVRGEDVSAIATRGRGKGQEAQDATFQILLDAFCHQQTKHPSVRTQDLVRLMRGEVPVTWEEE